MRTGRQARALSVCATKLGTCPELPGDSHPLAVREVTIGEEEGRQAGKAVGYELNLGLNLAFSLAQQP